MRAKLDSFTLLGLVAGLLLGASGCNTPKQAFLKEPFYATIFAVRDLEISCTGSIKVEEGADGVISIYNNAFEKSAAVKVSGKGKRFRIHGCGSVYVREGAVVDAYECTEVKAEDGTTVTAYQCGTVKAMPDAKVTAHGTTKVDQQLRPVEKK